MNNKSLTKLVLSAYIGIAGCTEREPAEAVGTVKYGFCDREENMYNLRLTNADVYLEESDELKAKNIDISAYQPECDLFQLVPEGTVVRAAGEYDNTDWQRILWSTEVYRLDTEELIYPIEKNE